MKRISLVTLAQILSLIILVGVVSSCASSIVRGEYSRLTTRKLAAKPETFDVPILLTPPADTKIEVVALVTAQAYVLDKAVTELKKQARQAGADALTDFKQERKVSIDYLQDLYFLEAKAVIFR